MKAASIGMSSLIAATVAACAGCGAEIVTESGGGSAAPVEARQQALSTNYCATVTSAFCDDFEDGNATVPLWTVRDQAVASDFSVVTDGSYVYRQGNSSTTNARRISTAGSGWANLTVEARVKVLNFKSTANFAGLYARYNTGNNSGYFLALRGDGKVNLGKKTTGSAGSCINATWPRAGTCAQTVSPAIVANTWYRLKLVLNGSTLTGYVNGTKVIEAKDSTITAAGAIGVGSTGGATFEADEITVNRAPGACENADGTLKPAGTVCRAAAGPCDVAETCTGSSAACPADAYAPTTTVCRPAVGPCDLAESCTGTSPACPADGFVLISMVCRAAAGPCDAVETCTGASPLCPADAFQPATTVCRASTGACDPAEKCTGTGASCPADVPHIGPPTPTGLAANPGNTQVRVMWNSSPGATSYNVKRSSTSGGPFTTVANAFNPGFTDTGLSNGTTYFYVVSANSQCGESTNSSQVAATPDAGGSSSAIIALPFPSGASRDSVAVAANGSLRLNDRTTAKRLDGSWAAVSNAGDFETNIGTDAVTGSVTSIASVTLRDRALISGDLKTAGTLTRQNGTTVTGTIVEHATLTPISVFSWTVQLPTSNSGDVILQPDTSQELEPGSYANVIVNSRARLSLKTGVYYMVSLGIETEAQLVLDKTNGPIIVYVTGTVAFKGKIVDDGGREGDFLLVCLGGTGVFIEQSFTGTIVAPNAKLTLSSSTSGHRGTFFARDIEIHQGNNIVAVPFGWTRLFDGQAKPRTLPPDPANPPRIPVGPFGTKLTPAVVPRVAPLTVYSGGIEFGVAAASAGSPVPAPRPQGITSPGYVDNINWGYVHEAFDYVTPTGAFAPDTPGRLVGLTLKRFYKPRFAGIVSSFGVGMFSNFDSKLRIVGNTTSGFQVLSFQMENDLGEVQWTETSADAGDSQIDGIFHTPAGLGPSLSLLAADGSPTPDPALATTAVLTEWNGNRQVFEIIDTVPNQRSARLSQLVDANGNAVSVAYKYPAGAGQGNPSKLWQIASVTDNYGLVGTFDYAASTVNGRWVVSAFHAPNGATITYTYDASQVVDGLVGPALKTVVEPDGAVSTFSTETEAATNLVIVHINDRAAVAGLMVKNVYLSQSQMRTASGSYVTQQPNLLRQIVNGAGEVAYANWDDGSQSGTTYVYEGGGSLLRIELRDGNTPVSFARANFYDPTLPPSQAVFDPVETYQTDGRGRITSKTDAAGRITTWARDLVSGVVNAVRLFDGSIQSRWYGALSRLISLVDRNGLVNAYTYDLKGNLQAAIAGVGLAESATSSIQVNARGQTTRATDARGNATDYAYDDRGFLISIVEPPDEPGGPRATTTFAYDNAGRMTLGTDPDGRKTQFEYDACNRLVRTTFADGSTQVVVYGTGASAGLASSTKDRNGNVTAMSYDGATRMVQMSEAVGTPSAVASQKTYLPGTLNLSTETKRGDRTTYGYDSKGRVVATTVLATVGRSLTSLRSFDALGRLVSTSDPYGRRTFLLYDADSRVTRRAVELVPGAVTGDVESLVRVAGPNPPYAIDDHRYAPTGEELESVDAVGTIIHNEYDGRGRIVTKVEAHGTPSPATWGYTYDPMGNLIGVKRPRSFVEDEVNATETSTYTGRNLLSSTIVAQGESAEARTRFTYTLTRKKASAVDPRGAVTQYQYSNCCDRLATVVDPSGATTRYAYDNNGNLLSTTDGNGNVSSSTYDALNRVASRTNGEGETTSVVYDDNLTDGQGIDAELNLSGLGFGPGADGSAAAEINPLGGKRYVVSDGAGRSVLEQDENGNATRSSYDAVVAGLLETTRTDALGHSSKNRTDGLGSARQVVDPEGGVTSSEFDAMGRLVAKHDPTGVGKVCSLDPFGRPTECTDTAGDQKRFAYDTEGNAISAFDGLGQPTYCFFDALNRKTSCLDRLGKQRIYGYDAASNRVSVSDAEGNVTSYAYDLRGLATEEHYADGGAVARQYDAARRLVSSTTADGLSTQMAYDRANRPIRREHPGGVADTFAYDRASRLVQGVSGRYQNTVDRAYDAGGRLLSESLTLEGVTRTVASQYDQANRRTALTYPDGSTVALTYSPRDLVSTVTSGGTTTANYTYDGAGKVTENLLGNGKREVYSYRNDGLVGAVAIDGVSSLSFEYDPNKRLKTEKRSGQVYDGFVLDAEERLVSWSFSGPTQTWDLSPEGDFRTVRSGGTVFESREHNSVHAVTSINETPLTYDGRGNLTKDRSGANFSWDSDNQLTSVSVDEGDTASYAYDAFGRRVSRRVGTSTTVYVSDGQQVLAEYENGTLARKVIPGLVIDQPIAMTSGGSKYYFARQLNGSVHALMSETGAVVERYEYTPHGWRTILAPDGSVRQVSVVGNAYGYTGRPHEPVGNIVDFRARQYSPDLGRFISRDDAYNNGLSLYQAYFPPDRTDPSGHLSLGDFNPVNLVKKTVKLVEEVGEAAVDVTVAGVKGAVGVGGTVVGVVTGVAHGAYDYGVSGISATVDGAGLLAGKGFSAAEQLGGLGWKLTAYAAREGYEFGVWTKDQTVNVAKGFAYDVKGWAREGLSQGWNLAQAGGGFGYWVLTEGSNPFAIMADPEGWASGALNAASKLGGASLSAALWTGTEFLPAVTAMANPFQVTTAIGLAIGVAGWIAGGDAPTLNWAAGGIVFEFGNSPFSWGAAARTYGRTIIYRDKPTAELRQHEFQHIKQFNLLGDLYLPAQILAIGVSCLFTNDYAAANPFEWGPYGPEGTLAGDQRPWPWAQTGPLLGTPQSGRHGKCIE